MCTMNNPEITIDELEEVAMASGADAFRGQRERGANGTPHFQFYVGFQNQRTLLSMTKLFKKCHIEICADPGAAWDYCGKEDTREEADEEPTEFGSRPAARRNVKDDVAKRNMAVIKKGIRKSIEDGDIRLQDACRIQQGINMYHADKEEPTAKPLKSQWIWGPTGTGKSRGVREDHPSLFIKNHNKWWDGYKNEDVVLIDDLEKSAG